jgi:hypothetical protein
VIVSKERAEGGSKCCLIRNRYDSSGTWHPIRGVFCLHLMSTEKVSRFIDRHIFLLSQERNAEIERSSLVFTKCGPKLLEQKGLALNGLGIANITVGLGNKTCVASYFERA